MVHDHVIYWRTGEVRLLCDAWSVGCESARVEKSTPPLLPPVTWPAATWLGLTCLGFSYAYSTYLGSCYPY
jgi:hypothetical protein